MEPTANGHRSLGRTTAVAVGVFFIFAVFAAWPAPDSNESGYLPQAKHYWDPSYCPGDAFLSAPAPHRLFCAATGWATRYCSLETFAWSGRLLVWALLAAAFTYLGRGLALSDRGILLAAAGYVCLAYVCQIAGEWIVGGFEAKGFAWALVWTALARFVRRDWYGALAFAGGAMAWHVLVGGWAVAGLVLASRPADWRASWSNRAVAAAAIFAGVCIGVLPSWGLNAGVEPSIVAEANRTYVFECAPFHLLPEHAHPARLPAFLLELFTWVWLVRQASLKTEEPQMRLQRVVVAALAIGALGLVVRLAAWTDADLTARLMRYYWFRLGDGVLPVGTAFAAAAWLGLRPGETPRRLPAAVAAGLTASILVGISVYRVVVPYARSDDQLVDPPGWRRACEWIRENTPADAVVLVPPDSQTLHWRAERAEVVTEKDLPHDAARLIAWKERIFHVRAAYMWTYTMKQAVVSRTDAQLLTAVAQRYGATFLVYADHQLPLPVAFSQEGSYTVYRVPTERGPSIEELFKQELPSLPRPVQLP
jgi:hypothetical protein